MIDKKQNVVQPAWDLFCKGDLGRAEQAAMQAAQKLKTTAVAPIPDIMILKAFYMCRLKRYQDARNLFGRVLEGSPDDSYAQEGYLLSLQDQLITKDGYRDRPTHDRRLLIGLGTGRSGSTSLTKLWRNQKNCYCSHEHPPRLSWKVNIPRFEFHRRRIAILQSSYKFVGDVSHWWLPYIDRVIENFNNVRVIVLKREKAATVNSFLKIKGGGGKGTVNHWVDHDGSYWVKNIWDECYPSYCVETVKEAIEHYWDNYYKTVESLAKRFPSKINIFPTEMLEDPDTQREILSFCGFEKIQIVEDLRLNMGSVSDGARMF